MTRVAGVLLAAGAGTRFGAVKQLAPLQGAPLVQHALDALLAADGLDDVVVVLGAHAKDVRAALRPSRARVLVAEDWADGLSASLRRGIAAAGARDATWALIALGDQPGLTAPAVDLLAAACRGPLPAACGAVRATYGGTPGHPVALHRRAFGRIGALTGDEGARALLPDLHPHGVEVGHLARPEDVDTPTQLEAIRS